MGRSVGANCAGLHEPRRKLHEDYCGLNKQLVVAPEESRPSKKAKTIVGFDFQGSRGVGRSVNSTEAPMIEKRSFGSSRSECLVPAASLVKHYSLPASVFPQQDDILQSDAPQLPTNGRQDATMTLRTAQLAPAGMSRRGSPVMASSSPMPQNMDGATSFTMQMTPFSDHHLKIPWIIPQKRYKGAASDPDSVLPPRLQKLGNPLEYLQGGSCAHSRSMLFGLDATALERILNTRRRPSHSKDENEPTPQPLATTIDGLIQNPDPSEMAGPRKITRIMFWMESKGLSRDVDRKKFETLGLPVYVKKEVTGMWTGQA